VHENSVVKKLKSSGIQECEIKNITGHVSANGLDDYDSGGEREQLIISRAIDKTGSVPSRRTVTFILQIPLHLCVLPVMFTISVTVAASP